MIMTKIIAMYLPQFHCIPENDEFWGKGFTDWVTVKKAKPLFEGHNQPRVPFNGEYYDLSEKDAVAWQCKIAREHGIYGFAIYHYWFNNEKNLLTKPVEIIRENKDININFFFTWDNCNWKRSWSNVSGNGWSPIQDQEQEIKGSGLLIPYILGEKPDWENHYNELRTYFLDDRYIKIENKPVFSIINHNLNIDRMCAYWDELARKDGFAGMFFIMKDGPRVPHILHRYSYEPHHVAWGSFSLVARFVNLCKRKLHLDQRLGVYDFDKCWKKLLRFARQSKDKNLYYGSFIGYDDTPRRGVKGKIVRGATPEKFERYLVELLSICESKNKEFLFFTAWNEWGEGAYLEPDTNDGFKYLQAVRNAVVSE